MQKDNRKLVKEYEWDVDHKFVKATGGTRNASRARLAIETHKYSVVSLSVATIALGTGLAWQAFSVLWIQATAPVADYQVIIQAGLHLIIAYKFLPWAFMQALVLIGRMIMRHEDWHFGDK